jgi:integrase
MIYLLRFTGLRISDVATLERDRVRDDRIYLYTMKNGKPVFLPIPPVLKEALEGLPTPNGTVGESKYFFWSGNGTTRAFLRDVTRTIARVFKHSGVKGAHAHRFRHTLATALLEKGWTTEDVALVLGSTPDTSDDTMRNGQFSGRNVSRAWRRMYGLASLWQTQKIGCNY